MTVIIKELIVKTNVVENINNKPKIDVQRLKNEVTRDCIQQLKKITNRKVER